MRVAVVGAGVAGLAAARTLARAGHPVVVFEKSAGFGGRVATRRAEGFTFDTGATSIAPRGRELENVMLRELDTSELVRVERPIYMHAYGRISPGDGAKNKIERYCYTSGINRLGKLLAEGLDVRLEHKVDRIETPADGGYAVMGEAFDALVLSAPIPQSEELLQAMGQSRAFANARYRPCLSLLLGYAAPFEAPYHALIDPEQKHPLTWISVESLKVPGHRAPAGETALVCQMSPRYSQWNYDKPDEAILKETLVDLERLLGNAFGEPKVAEVKRWRYSQPETTASFDTVNPRGSRIVVASDGLTGGRIELAYEAGTSAARRLMEA